LGIDTSENTVTAAIDRDGSILAWDQKIGYQSHCKSLADVTGSLFARAGVKIKDLDVVLYVRGPGSYTGLRIGGAFAMGLVAGNHAQIAGVSSLEALALSSSGDSLIRPVIDARADRIYTALFQKENFSWKRLEEDHASTVSELMDEAHGPIFYIGSGAAKCHIRPIDSFQVASIDPKALFLCRRYTDAEPVNYLKPSQAERLKNPPG
jgi:tRNA threonylcarbamoyladenosine biosynthesis protein TsaB